MDVKLTVTNVLDDNFWGFSDVLEGFDDLSPNERQAMIIEYIRDVDAWQAIDPDDGAIWKVSIDGDEPDWQARAEAAEKEIETLRFAAQMPDDYEYGLTSWIHQYLYAAYIGAKIPQSVLRRVAEGTLVFPEAPINAELDKAKKRIAALEAQLAAQAWRPVTEPPTENGDYLAYSWPGECEVLSFNDGYWSFVPVTHWRPLPAPPSD